MSRKNGTNPSTASELASNLASVLRADPRNARKHGDRNKKLIRQSLKEVGAGRSIMADADGIVRAGNGVLEQAQEMGIPLRIVESDGKELVVVKRTDLRGKRAERAALLDNRTQELSETDADVISQIAQQEAALLEGLYTNDELLELEAIALDAWGEPASSRAENMRNENERAKFLELVVQIDEHAVIERAIAEARSTNGCGRGEAFRIICEAYLNFGA